MSLDAGIIADHVAAITAARDTGTVQDQKDAVAAYYDYLTGEGVAYGTLAKDTALDQGDFGSFANDYLAQAGASSESIDKIRVALALADAGLRTTDLSPPTSGDGVLSPSAIAQYHYSVFGASPFGLPKEAWAGSLFEEFAGTGSWLDFAQTHTLDADEVEAIGLAYATNSTVNGVNARTAIGYIEDTVAASPGSHGLLTGEIFVGSLANVSISAIIPGDGPDYQDSLEELAWDARLHDIYENSALHGWLTSEGQSIAFSDNNTVTYTDDSLTPFADLDDLYSAIRDALAVDDLGGIINNSETLIVNATDGEDTVSFEYVPASENGQTFNSTSSKVFYFEEGGSGFGITYASLSGGNGISVDLTEGTATIIGEGSPKDFLNGAIRHVTGSNYADEIVADAQNSSLSGGNGDDLLYGGAGDDTLDGGSGNDTADYRGDGAVLIDFILGTAEDGYGNVDTLVSIEGFLGDVYAADTVEGLNGGETVDAGGGGDLYSFTPGVGGATTVLSFDPTSDKLDLSEFHLFPSQVENGATESGGDTTLHLAGGQTIFLPGVTKNDLFDPGNGALLGLIGGTAGSNLVGNSSANQIDATHADINGHYATANNDTLTGYAGGDVLNGGAGSDLYVEGIGDGYDTINEGQGGDSNIIQVNATRAQTYIEVAGNNLYVVVFDGTTMAYTNVVNEWYNTPDINGWPIRYIQTSDGTIDLGNANGNTYGTWYAPGDTVSARPYVSTPDTLVGAGGNDLFYGNAGNNVLQGKGGNDNLQGGAGSDRYVFDKGDGADTIYETQSTSNTNVLQINAALSQIHLTMSAAGSHIDLVAYVNDGTPQGSVVVVSEFYNDPQTNGYMMSTLQASDGSIDLTGAVHYSAWDDAGDWVIARLDDARNDTLTGGAGSDGLSGGPGNDSLSGMAGNETMTGYLGNDTLDGGAGNDTMDGGAGNDTFIFQSGYGHDVVIDTSGSNTLQIGSYHHYADNGYDRTYYRDATNTDYVTITDWAHHSSDWTIA